MKITKEKVREIIDRENGKGFSRNINLNGYMFTHKNSFIVFELKVLDEIRICHIKYIYFDNVKDLITIMVYACNFWLGNKVQFLFFKEKKKNVSAIKFLENLNFRKEMVENYNWPYKFECKLEDDTDCNCPVYTLYK